MSTNKKQNKIIIVNIPLRYATGLIEILGEPITREDHEDSIMGADTSYSVLTWPYSGSRLDIVESFSDGDVFEIEVAEIIEPVPRAKKPKSRGVRSGDSILYIDMAHQAAGPLREDGKRLGGASRRTGGETLTWDEFVALMAMEAADHRLAEQVEAYVGRRSQYRHRPKFRPSDGVKYGSGFCHGVRDTQSGRITEVSMLVIDEDGLPQAGLDLMLARLRQRGDGAWQATTSDSPESRRVLSANNV